VAYSEFKAMVKNDKIVTATLRGQVIEGTLGKPLAAVPGGEPRKHVRTRRPPMGDDELLPLLEHHNVKIDVKAPPTEGGWPRVLGAFLPWIILLAFYFWFMRRIAAGGVGRVGDLGKFLKPRSTSPAKPPKITFDDVAGQDNAKREVAELVDYLRSPQQYTQLGAEVPHGVLLMGPPGTGKTLLAKALAGEANVPFFSISASEFIEMFVGVGASRVRELFRQAKTQAPSILFIDELDSIGRVRGAGLGGGHDEREQTLNQILAEMDGFAGHEAVIVLAATNRPDVLDPALLRPGRFDRHVSLDLPDRKARSEILKVHTKRIPLSKAADLDKIAAGTPGFSGADLKNLVNEAAMRAARERRDEVTMEDFDEMRDRVLLGVKRSLALQPEQRHRLAVHEAGHAAVAYFLPNADPLYKVTIIPRGRSLGATQQLPTEERQTLPEEYLRDRLAVILGGRIAERVLLGSVSSGADDDIRQATSLARAMVTRWGMSESIGPVDLRESEEHPFLGREIAQPRRHSETSARAVDEAVRELLQQAEARAEGVIIHRRGALEHLIVALEEHETLSVEQIVDELGPSSPQQERQSEVQPF
jgi:cell division protease FtsH